MSEHKERKTLEERQQMSDLERLRHSCAHVLATAICRLWPDAQLAGGPAVDNGFYYDVELDHRISTEDFERIEEEMKKVVKENQVFQKEVISRADAMKMAESGELGALGPRSEPSRFKIDLLNDIPEDEEISLYRNGDFTDLCAGPHVGRTGNCKAFKIMSVASAFYKGDKNRPMLQRIYGTCFPNRTLLDEHLERLEEARRRDHRKLGRELGLFCIDESVGQGLILWKPKGALIRRSLQDFITEELDKLGYSQVYTPNIGKLDLYRTSGHFPYYQESQYAPIPERDAMEKLSQEGASCAELFNGLATGTIEGYMLKPMNCPHHIKIYANDAHSYRDLPVRLAEFGTVYRWEQSGELGGMTRVRGFTQDDAHIFMTPEQIRDDLFPAGDTAVTQHAITVEQYVEQLLTRIISFSAQPLLWLDSACGCYCLAVEKRDNYNKKITLEQLSQLINISRTTIYKVINGKGRVSESTRALVEKALLEYNYVPNFNARDLAYHKTYRIGYIGMAHYGSTFFSKLMQDGIRKALAELEDNGLQIVSAISYILEPQQQITDIERMLQSGIRAFIIVPCDPKVLEPEIKKLRELHCDIIYLSRYVEKKDRVFVGIDYPQSGRLAAEMMSKMLPQGGNIAITTSNFLEDDLWVKQRYDGFVDYLKGRSSYRILGLWDTISDEKSAELICQELMEKHPDISGIYDISYKSEAIARRLVRMRRDQDIKLIGFDYYDAVKPFIRSSAIDVIIGQSLPNQAYDAVKMMFYHLCYGVPLVNKDYNSRLDVIVSSNMDYFEG